jgi:hypothetical protein
MRYITNAAVVFKGDRIGRGVEIELTPADAAILGSDVAPVGAQPVEEAAPELASIPLEEMSFSQLKDRAKELGLSATGSKADLQERITLHLADQG